MLTRDDRDDGCDGASGGGERFRFLPLPHLQEAVAPRPGAARATEWGKSWLNLDHPEYAVCAGVCVGVVSGHLVSCEIVKRPSGFRFGRLTNGGGDYFSTPGKMRLRKSSHEVRAVVCGRSPGKSKRRRKSPSSPVPSHVPFVRPLPGVSDGGPFLASRSRPVLLAGS
jgi:hypothetical protein